jgi:hypothetical protein
MKTTLDIPDDLYRETKALAALSGRTVKDLITELLKEKIEQERRSKGPRGWRSAFGKVSAADADRVQAIVDDELSRVDAEDWR